MTVKKKKRELDINTYLGDFEFIEDILKNLIILNHLVLTFRIEIDLVHGHNPRMDRIHKLAVYGTRTSLRREKSIQETNIKKSQN